ncbi:MULTISPECIES: cupin domain-containing protein [Caproicibacterium]|uniref:Cupin domain-containing protein n=1 Tax=Caproicibacterium argilliputei TaxID=3030016 RepID=A0AA97D8R6_9FIRM|nr:cupin domain-containing protein [Caproicibacterium argilliputei]WOC31364.1 cupin domain-containing protein [Caproicibacterium argilliputei]
MMDNRQCPCSGSRQRNPIVHLTDHGPEPYALNLAKATRDNRMFRTALWTGKHLQLTVMNINPGQEIGLEMHPDTDQMLYVEDGHGMVRMGKEKDNLDFRTNVFVDDAFLVPAGYWHNVINSGVRPLKLFSVYAPPEHPRGTVHATKEDAEEQH